MRTQLGILGGAEFGHLGAERAGLGHQEVDARGEATVQRVEVADGRGLSCGTRSAKQERRSGGRARTCVDPRGVVGPTEPQRGDGEGRERHGGREAVADQLGQEVDDLVEVLKARKQPGVGHAIAGRPLLLDKQGLLRPGERKSDTEEGDEPTMLTTARMKFHQAVGKPVLNAGGRRRSASITSASYPASSGTAGGSGAGPMGAAARGTSTSGGVTVPARVARGPPRS